MEKAFRKTGIDIIGDAPWGTHFCQFYETREDLVDILVPYFKAGLENNEFCMWITSEPLKVEDAKAALKKVVKNLDHFIKKGQIEILDYSEWYAKSGKFDANNVLQGWVEKENQALKRGYDGLRSSGNISWLEKGDWRNFANYEEEINKVIGKYRMIGICSYSLGQCGASEVIDVASNHQFAFIRREGKWVTIESSERKQAEELLKKSEERFRTSVENLLEGFAILSAVRDSHGQIIDFKYDYINEAGCKMNQKPFEEHMGKTLLELLPTHKGIGLFDEYARVVETGQSLTKEFLIYEDVYGGWKRLRQAFNVQITRLEDGLVTTWQDLTDKKKGEELLRQSEERLRSLIENAKDVVIMTDLEGSIIYYNGPPEYGITAEQVLGKNPFSIFDPLISARLMNQLKLVIKNGEALTFENAIPLKGESYWFLNQMYPIRDEKGRMSAVGLIARNITERKRAEAALRVSHRFLEIANRHTGMNPLLNAFMMEVQKITQCAAVGFRILDEEGNIPYQAYNGFSQRFYESESPLSIKSDQCMCINVVKGVTDPKVPFYTEGGSFYMNGTTRFLATVSEEEKGQTRNVCNQVGYESVALVPIRLGDRILGLIHVADPQENMVPLETVQILEWVAIQLGGAMQRVRVEEELRKERMLSDSIVENTPAGIAFLDNDFVLRKCNRFYADLIRTYTPYSPEQALGMSYFDYAPGSREQVEGWFLNVRNSGQTEIRHGFRLAIKRDGGEEVTYWDTSIAPVFGPAKNVEGILILTQDMTERKRAEEALQRSEQELRLTLDATTDGIYKWNLKTDKLFFSPRYYTVLGYEPGDFPASYESWKDLIHPDDLESALHVAEKYLETKPDHYENVFRLRTKTGEFRWIHARSKVVERDEHGDAVRLIGNHEDITERKQAEVERERLLADLEAKNREMEAFIYTVSHDLKAPLVSLNGFSGALQKEYESQLGEEGRHYLDRIQANVAHMEALTTSLLELSRIGQVVGSIEEIDVAALLREIWNALAVRLKEAGAEFVVQEPLPTVRADRGRIHQVFANLIDNAVKFRSAERALRIEVGCRQESGFFRFHVADNGIGITPQYHEQIFTPFRKMHPEIEGVGIGLALVKKIVEHHGGRTWVESEAGKGSTFYFTLPMKGESK